MDTTIPQVDFETSANTKEVCNSHDHDSQVSLANVPFINYLIPINSSNKASVEVVSYDVLINDYGNDIRSDAYGARFYSTSVSNSSNTPKPANKVIKWRRTSSGKSTEPSIKKKSKLTQRQKSNVSADGKSCRLSPIAGNLGSREPGIFCNNQFCNFSYSLSLSNIFSEADDSHSLQKPHLTDSLNEN